MSKKESGFTDKINNTDIHLCFLDRSEGLDNFFSEDLDTSERAVYHYWPSTNTESTIMSHYHCKVDNIMSSLYLYQKDYIHLATPTEWNGVSECFLLKGSVSTNENCSYSQIRQASHYVTNSVLNDYPADFNNLSPTMTLTVKIPNLTIDTTKYYYPMSFRSFLGIGNRVEGSKARSTTYRAVLGSSDSYILIKDKFPVSVSTYNQYVPDFKQDYYTYEGKAGSIPNSYLNTQYNCLGVSMQAHRDRPLKIYWERMSEYGGNYYEEITPEMTFNDWKIDIGLVSPSTGSNRYGQYLVDCVAIYNTKYNVMEYPVFQCWNNGSGGTESFPGEYIENDYGLILPLNDYDCGIYDKNLDWYKNLQFTICLLGRAYASSSFDPYFSYHSDKYILYEETDPRDPDAPRGYFSDWCAYTKYANNGQQYPDGTYVNSFNGIRMDKLLAQKDGREPVKLEISMGGRILESEYNYAFNYSIIYSIKQPTVSKNGSQLIISNQDSETIKFHIYHDNGRGIEELVSSSDVSSGGTWTWSIPSTYPSGTVFIIQGNHNNMNSYYPSIPLKFTI